MHRLIATLVLAAISTTAMAASPFDQVQHIENQHAQAQAAAKADALSKAQAAQAQQNALYEEMRRKELAAKEKQRAQAAAISKTKSAEVQRKKRREEAFEDEQRALALEEKRLALQEKKAKVARSDEYIDAELRHRAANTDVIQSAADATRNVSSGTKSLLEDTGKADVNRSNKFFE